MRVVVCAIAKKEHKYINQWVKHYVDLGVDKIYLYDNDDINEKYIGCYINEKYANKIYIINVRGVKRPLFQHDCYTKFYWKYREYFDYCLFCDIDEYLVGVKNIKEWLSKMTAKQIRIKWRLFGDDNVIERDTNIPMIDFFKKPVTSSLHRNLNQKGNLESQGKFILKGGMFNIYINSCHYGCIGNSNVLVPSVLPSGKPCKSYTAINEDYSQETIYLNHYMTKTLKEFVEQKLNRNDAVYNTNLKLDYFWRINAKTPEKLEWLKKKGLL